MTTPITWYVYKMPPDYEHPYEVDRHKGASVDFGGVEAAGPFLSYEEARAALIDEDPSHPFHPRPVLTPAEFDQLIRLGKATRIGKVPFVYKTILDLGECLVPCRIKE